MRAEYDFSNASKNPYIKQLQRQVTIRLDVASADYFKALAAEMGISYQNLISLYLQECAAQKKKPVLR